MKWSNLDTFDLDSHLKGSLSSPFSFPFSYSFKWTSSFTFFPYCNAQANKMCFTNCSQLWCSQENEKFFVGFSVIWQRARFHYSSIIFMEENTRQQSQKNADNKFRKRLDIISDYYHAHLYWHSTSITCEGSSAGCQMWANWQAIRVPTGGIQLEYLLQHQQSLAFKIRQKCGVCWPGNKDRKLMGIDRNVSLPFCYKSYKERD